jgi:hypothetical protein
MRVRGRYAFSRLALSKAVAGERRATLGSPASPVTTRISRLFANRAPMTPNAWRVTVFARARNSLSRRRQPAKWQTPIASPAICQSMSCRKRTLSSLTIRFAWSAQALSTQAC